MKKGKVISSGCKELSTICYKGICKKDYNKESNTNSKLNQNRRDDKETKRK